nr:putative protein SNX29P2 [Symphalangus syndactylus]
MEEDEDDSDYPEELEDDDEDASYSTESGFSSTPESCSVAQAGEQWHSHHSLQPPPSGLKPSSHLSVSQVAGIANLVFI